MSLLERSAVGAPAILIVLLLRALLGRRLPRRTFVALWWTIAARLLLPWAVPIRTHVPAGAPAIRRTILLLRPDGLPTGAAAPASSSFPVWRTVYLAGAIALSVWFLFSYLRWRRRFADSRPADLPWVRKHPRVSVRICKWIDAPVACGVLRPTILLPEGVEEGLEDILAHEYAHLRHLDPLAKLVFAAALCVHWFDPLVWVLWRTADRDMELDCDREAVLRSGRPVEYAKMLLGMEERRSRSLYSNFSQTAIEERIKEILYMRKEMKKTSALALVCALLLVALTATALAAAIQPGEDPAESEMPVQTLGSEIDAPEAPAENEAPAEEDALLWPTESTVISSGFETRSRPDGSSVTHDGIDIAGDSGAAVYASLDGTVADTGYNGRQGRYVLLSHDGGLETLYCHCESVCVQTGDTVSRGDTIGAVGSTGQSTGPHLHFEVRQDGVPVEPVFPD